MRPCFRLPGPVQPIISIGRIDGDCPGQILTQRMEQMKFPFSVHACLIRKVFPQVSLRQQVGKKGHQPHSVWAKLCAQFAELILEVQAEGWAGRIVDIVLVEGKQGAVAGKARQGSDLPAEEFDVQNGHISHRHRPRQDDRRACCPPLPAGPRSQHEPVCCVAL